ncbi:MAG TPA: M56 family metallopeptidase, partial [Vicinamibacterales bacterium]|nr:M56 family metallopeptidase [Vicinamibacterales bacterium]
WTTPVPVPILPAASAPAQRPAAAVTQIAVSPSRVPHTASPIDARAFANGVREWTSFAAIGWTAGIGLVTFVALRRWRGTTRLLASSAPAAAAVQERTRDLALRLGVRRIPDVRVSPEIDTPLVTGLLRPVVLVPAGRFDALTERQQQMALCHELAHLERSDLLFGCVPALAERLFFFHPLAHVAAREYAIAREAACDAAVVDALDVAPREYGELLLALGVSNPRTSVAAAGAAWSFQNLKRRIAMLHDEPGRSRRSKIIAAGVVGLAAAAMVPLQLVARPALPAGQRPAAPGAGVERAVAQREAVVREAGERLPHAGETVEVQSADRDPRYVLLEKDDQITSGDDGDARRAKRYQQNGDPLLWFQRDGREYVIRDRDVVRMARSILAPLVDSGLDHEAIEQLVKSLNVDALVEQGRFMAEQGALAAEQGRAAAEQAIESAHIGELASEQVMRALAESHVVITEAERKAFDAQRRSLKDSRDDVDERLRELEERLKRDLGDQMRELQERVRALEGPIREMTAPLEHLDRDLMRGFAHASEDVARKVKEDIRKLLEEAIASGVARPVR